MKFVNLFCFSAILEMIQSIIWLDFPLPTIPDGRVFFIFYPGPPDKSKKEQTTV
jgi:hypothetical protein